MTGNVERLRGRQNRQRKRGTNSGAHIIRTMDGITSGPGRLEAFKENRTLGIFLLLTMNRKKGTVGEEEAEGVGQLGKMELDENLRFLVWFTNRVTRRITDGKEIGRVEISGDCFSNEPRCLTTGSGRGLAFCRRSAL